MLFRCSAVAVLLVCAGTVQAESDVKQLTRWLLQEDRELENLPFSEVIEASTGKKILPIDEENPATRRVLREIAQAADLTLR